MMQPTGERFLPEMEGAYIAYEHWHRYLFATRFVRDKAVLDVACGEGYGSNLLAGSAAAVVGVDIDPEAVRHASASYPRDNLTFRRGAAEDIPIPEQHSFDVVVSFETLEHLSPESQRRFAQEIKRLLRPGGLLLISTPNRAIYSERNQHQNPFHQHELTRPEFSRFLTQYFRHVQVLSQRVYPGSYIWNLDQPTQQCDEYELALEHGQLRPAHADGKEQLYYLALCSDDVVSAPNSLMLDLDEVAIRGRPDLMTTLFVDSGEGFRAEEAFRLPMEDPASFRLHFRLSQSPSRPVCGLRWDPLEMRTCRVALESVSWQSPEGQIHEVDLDRVTSNGAQESGGVYRFDNFDPMLYLPVQGTVAALIIRGRCEVDDLATSMKRVDDRLTATHAGLLTREQRLQEVEDGLAHSQHQCGVLNAQMSGQQKQLGAQAQELAAVSARLRISEQEHAACAKARAQLADHVLICEQESALLMEHLAGYVEERAELAAQLDRYEKERARFLDGVHAAAQQQAQLAVLLRTALDENTASAAELRQSEEERARLAACLRASEEECQGLARRIEAFEKEKARLDRNLPALITSQRWRWATRLRSAVYFLRSTEPQGQRESTE